MSKNPTDLIDGCDPVNKEILMQQFVEGTLREGDAERLLTLLRDHPTERRILAWHVDLDAVLREKVSPTSVSEPGLWSVSEKQDPLFFDRLAALEKDSPSLPDKTRSTAKKKPSGRNIATGSIGRKHPNRRRLLLGTVVSAVIVVFAIGVFHELFRPTVQKNQDHSIARVIETVDVVWEENTETFKAGQEIDATRLKLKSGILKLRIGSDVHLTLEGPGELLIKAKDKTFCSIGQLSVRVGPRGKGFEIATPLTTIVDLGTAFALTASDKKTAVHVISGKVEARQAVVPSVVLAEGTALEFDLAGSREIPWDANLFLSDSRLQARIEEYMAKRRPTWEKHFSTYKNDGALLEHFVSQLGQSQGETVGSRPDRVGICFNGPEDRREITPMKRSRNLTLIASVMPREMQHVSNTLLIGDEFYQSAGQFVWQLDRSGVVQFHVNIDGKGRLERYDSGRIVLRKDWNTWMMLALVIDAERKTVTHYFDGRAVSTIPWTEDIELVMNRMSIGDEQPTRKKTNRRYFHGCMEELWIFDRPFSGDEIKQFYDNNR